MKKRIQKHTASFFPKFFTGTKANEAVKLIRHDSRPILIVTGQKTGTHLVLKILDAANLIKGKRTSQGPGRLSSIDLGTLNYYEYLQTHQAPEISVFSMIEKKEACVIFNYRDPRDVIVSNYFWLSDANEVVQRGNVTREYLKKAYFNMGNKEKILEFMIRCQQILPEEQTLMDWFYKTRGLFLHPNVYKTNYETLVGARGGGDDAAQRNMVEGLFKFLSIEADVNKIIKQAYDEGQETFRKGTIGDYRNHFTPQLESLFLELHGQTLDLYGYKR